MEPPVAKKREHVARAPVPTPRRSTPAPVVPQPDARKSIKETAINARNKINKSILSSGKFAREALEQGLPNRKSAVVPTKNTSPISSGSCPNLNGIKGIQDIKIFDPLNNENIPLEINFNDNINDLTFTDIHSNYDKIAIPIRRKINNENNYGNIAESSSKTYASKSDFYIRADIKDDSNTSATNDTVHLSINNLSSPRNECKSMNLIELANDTSTPFNDDSSLFRNNNSQTTLSMNNITSGNLSREHASKSTIMEFDPFAKNNIYSNTDTKTNEKLLMEAFLQNYYSDNLVKMDDDVSETSDNDIWIENSDLSPPTPPERVDSLEVDNTVDNVSEKRVSNSQWFCVENEPVSKLQESSIPPSPIRKSKGISKKFSQLLKSVPESTLQFRQAFETKTGIATKKVEKPPLSKQTITHEGQMVRSLSAPIEELFKHFQDRYCILTNQTLYCYTDSNVQGLKEKYPLSSFYSVQVIKKQNANVYHHFQLNLQSTKAFTNNRNTITFGCKTSAGRALWLTKIVESATNSFPISNITKLTRFGWCFMKGNMSQPWESGWLLLCRRFLYYHTYNEKNVQIFDLRKARFVVLKNLEENANVNAEDGPCLILDFQGETLYLRMGCSAETKIWKRIIKSVATDNGKSLVDLQLTKDDIPTIVHKCINFISCYGSLSEGIYRRTGALIIVNQLLEKFKTDAWEFNLSPSEYCEYAVATALKRFFRDLSEPLLPHKYHNDLFLALALNDKDDKIQQYKYTLAKLDVINKNTLRALIGHLKFIHNLCDENFMSVDNLSSIWAPTLMPLLNSNDETLHQTVLVIKDLVCHFMEIYNPTSAEISKEINVLNVLKKFHTTSVPLAVRPSGEFHVWIHYGDETPINILVNPNKSSGDICIELCSRINEEPHLLCIEEVICDENMYRPLHHSEIVLDIVFNWGAWDECDRKENYLRLRINTFLREISSYDMLSPHSSFKNKILKFADEKSKSFKNYVFDFVDDTLVCYKNKSENIILESWHIPDIRWYIGHESKRNPQCEWSITFIKHKKKTSRSKGKPWFGNIIAGQNRNDLISLISHFMNKEHPGGILPEPQLIIT